MTAYPFGLEKGSKKAVCPRCGRKSFKRIIENATGLYLPDHVGRCDHESSCGYEYTWKQYFRENPGLAHRPRSKPGTRASQFMHVYARVGSTEHADREDAWRLSDYMGLDHLLPILRNYEHNPLVQYLLELFPHDQNSVEDVLKEYLIGTKDHMTVFPTIDISGRLCKAKMMTFDQQRGKRIKAGYSISSLEYSLKRKGILHDEFSTDKNVFFGEHLLSKYARRPIAIVESEKTALVASICKAAFPYEFVWLATGSKSWLKHRRLQRLGINKNIILYPDADGFQKWSEIAVQAQNLGMRVTVSGVIQKFASADEKAQGFDLADYLVREQNAINQCNEDIFQERIAVMVYEGGIPENEAGQMSC
jgi:hypothetical protein